MYFPWEAAIELKPQSIPQPGSAVFYGDRLELAIPDIRFGLIWKYPFVRGIFFLYPTVARFGDAYTSLKQAGVLARFGVDICRQTVLHEIVQAEIGFGDGAFETVYLSMISNLRDCGEKINLPEIHHRIVSAALVELVVAPEPSSSATT